MSGEMFVSVGGRVARAFVTETEGLYRPNWSIDDVGENIAAMRDTKTMWTFQPVPTGFGEHLGASFDMARKGGA